jgi:exopolysaccharide production protein ExoQ
MPPAIPLILCTGIVILLLKIERDRYPLASWALWVPTCWMLIAGSRPIARWFETGQGFQQLDGSSYDRLALSILTLLGLIFAYRNRRPEFPIIRGNLWLFMLFLFMGLSILWVDNPFISFKRWIKSAGALAMALVILTESNPLEAFGSVLRRCAYILVPLSLILVKYFPEYGRAYNIWSGLEMWTGVTTHKNSLGQVCAVSVFFLVWQLLRKDRLHVISRSKPRTYADIFVLLVALFLLIGPGGGTYSATAIFVTVLGVVIFMVLDRREGLAHWLAANLKVIFIGLVLFYLLLAEPLTAVVTSILGRDENLTGRATDIWPLVLEMAARHPILGAGYGGVWGLGSDLSLAVGVEQAHNGFLDVYLELGAVGIALLAAFILSVCQKIRRVIDFQFEWGVFGISFLPMILIYNLSETAFFDVYLGVAMVLFAVVLTRSVKGESGEKTTQGTVHRMGLVPTPR